MMCSSTVFYEQEWKGLRKLVWIYFEVLKLEETEKKLQL